MFSACEKDEKEDPNVVQLEVFGPSPVLRGGEIKFIGKNLDKVTAVVLADGLEITDIEVKSPQEIAVHIPQDAEPGHITLKYANGEIKTKTPLTFSEPIAIEKVSPSGVKAGTVLTIEGDYLNLIEQVIFAQDVIVESGDFVSHSRKKIEVTVPKEAQTGKISLSNGAEIPIIIYSPDEIVVTQPKITTIAPNPIKPGQILTLTGTDFQLVESILFADDIAVTDFTLNTANSEIKVSVPAAAKQGSVKLLTFSGIEIESEALNLIAPAIQTLTPNPVKNEANLKIDGTHLDLVTSVVFAGGDAGEIVAQSAASITVKVPEKATDGDLVLATASGYEVSASYTLIKPLVTSTSSPIIGGQTLTLNGTNLDLVASVAFENYTETVDIISQTSTAIQLVIPNTVLGSVMIQLTSKNGNVVDAIQVSVTPTSLAYVSSMPTEANQKTTITLTGGNFDKVTGVTLGGQTVEWARAGASTLFVIVPANASPGNQTIVLNTAGGSTSYVLKVIGTGPVVTDIWTGSVDMGGWSGNIQLAANLFSSVVVGDEIQVTVNPASVQGNSQGSFKDGSWAQIAPGTEYFNISGDFRLSVTAEVLTKLQSGGLVISGQNYVATKVSVIH